MTPRDRVMVVASLPRPWTGSQIDTVSSELETSRLNLADALYQNLGALMRELGGRATRPQIAAFFDLELLQQSQPEEEEPPPIPPGGGGI